MTKTYDLIKDDGKNLEDFDEEIPEIKYWKNLSFTFGGESYFGTMLHPTEEEARERHSTVMSSIDGNRRMIFENNVKIQRREISHAIQIPITKD